MASPLPQAFRSSFLQPSFLDPPLPSTIHKSWYQLHQRYNNSKLFIVMRSVEYSGADKILSVSLVASTLGGSPSLEMRDPHPHCTGAREFNLSRLSAGPVRPQPHYSVSDNFIKGIGCRQPMLSTLKGIVTGSSRSPSLME